MDDALAAGLRDSWNGEWDTWLADRKLPLEERLGDFYCAYHARSDALSMRLFVRAGLEGHSLPGRHGARLTTRIFEPVIAALREEAGLPPFSERSEEHTSELQSLMRISYAVFCLKKKKKIITKSYY